MVETVDRKKCPQPSSWSLKCAKLSTSETKTVADSKTSNKNKKSNSSPAIISVSGIEGDTDGAGSAGSLCLAGLTEKGKPLGIHTIYDA